MNDSKASATAWLPRITISAPQGHSGKTVISLGLCVCLKKRGVRVQSFKKGPDYIDPSWLAAATGRDCHNLDPLLMSKSRLFASFQQSCREAEFCLLARSTSCLPQEAGSCLLAGCRLSPIPEGSRGLPLGKRACGSSQSSAP